MAKKSKKKKKGKVKKEAGEEPEDIEGEAWVSPICFESKSASARMRETLEELGYKFERKRTQKPYSQFMILLPFPRVAYVFRFVINKPIKLLIDFYDTKQSHAGILPYMGIEGVTEQKMPVIKKILDGFIEKLPRKPWEFTMGQKLQHGLLIPEWGRAKKAWRKLEYEVK